MDLLRIKSKKHLRKAEVVERKSKEVYAGSDVVKAPPYLSAKQKREFNQIAAQLIEIGTIINLDCDMLACLIKSRDDYLEFDKITKWNGHGGGGRAIRDKAQAGYREI